MLKKLSLILIIIVLAYSQVGYYFVMRHFQNEQKEAIKEKIFRDLPIEELQVFSAANIHEEYWEEEGREFIFKGELYDVVKRQTIDGKEIYYCLNDKKEKSLVDSYNLVTKHNSASDKKGKSSPDNSSNLFVYDLEHINIDLLERKADFISFDSRLSENITERLLPPPKA